MEKMLERIIFKLDKFNNLVGEKALWLVLAMILLQFSVVLLSKLYGLSFTPLDESIWYLNGLIFMLGAAYTLLHDRHVRVDIIYAEAGSKYKAMIDLFGALCFILPVAFITFGLSCNFVLDSWFNFSTGQWIIERAEGSPDSLPLLSLFKTVIWLYSLLLALTALSLAAKAVLSLTGKHQTYNPAMHSKIKNENSHHAAQ